MLYLNGIFILRMNFEWRLLMKQFKGYMHGINLGGWLSQCVHTKEHYDSFISESDIENIKSWGLDHIRVPVDYNLVEDEAGNYIEEGFKYIDNVLDWAEKNGLNMVLDLHKTFGFSFDSGEEETGFFETPAYQKYSDRLCFEILNEVTEKEYCEIWNDISHKCIEKIRESAPDIKILIGGYYNNSIEALKDLEMPYDENIIYNFHCYEPLIFTHQGGYWVPGMNTEFRMSIDSSYKQYSEYTAANLDRYAEDLSGYDMDAPLGTEYFERIIGEAVRVAEERNVALYCGEYGVINLATAEDSLKWYQMICSVFDKYGIGRAAWSYKKMDFGIIDDHMKEVFSDMIKTI